MNVPFLFFYFFQWQKLLNSHLNRSNYFQDKMQTNTIDPGNSVGAPQRSSEVAGTSSKEYTKPDYSCIRCKTALIAPNEEQYDALKRRLQERMSESRGETVYEIGVGEGMDLV